MTRSFGARLKLAVFWLAKHAGFFSLSRRLTRRGLRILCYHGVWMSGGHFSKYLFMSAATFRSRLALLQRLSLPVLSLDDAVKGLADGTLPDCATVITIDDGWYGSYLEMAPELVRLGLPATIYLTSYYCERQFPVFDVALQFVLSQGGAKTLDLTSLDPALGGKFRLDTVSGRDAACDILQGYARRLNGQEAFDLLGQITLQLGIHLVDVVHPRQFHLMTPAEATEIARQGIDIQLHTHRHRLVTDDLAVVTAEITENRRRLERIASRKLQHFCYPSGAWSPKVWPILERLGIVSATTTAQGLNFPGAPLLGLSRLTDGECVHDLEFEAELCGFSELMRRSRNLLRPGAKP